MSLQNCHTYTHVHIHTMDHEVVRQVPSRRPIFWKPLVNHKQKYFRHDPACVETSRAGFGSEAAPARLLPVLHHVRNLKIAY